MLYMHYVPVLGLGYLLGMDKMSGEFHFLVEKTGEIVSVRRAELTRAKRVDPVWVFMLTRSGRFLQRRIVGRISDDLFVVEGSRRYLAVHASRLFFA